MLVRATGPSDRVCPILCLVVLFESFHRDVDRGVVVAIHVVSTGTWRTPTVTGVYRIYVKYRTASMSGADYFLPNVPYVMYFYKGYGIHGTYWHSNFGTPMSHGCVNLSPNDAGWLFEFAKVGTVVQVHY